MTPSAWLPLLAFFTWNGLAVSIASSAASWLWLLPLLGAAIATTFVAERFLPFRNGWNRSHGDAPADRLHAAVNETLTIAFVGASPLALAWLPVPSAWPADWPLWMQLGIAILVADFGIAFVHAASHRIGWLWRLHAIHHGAPRLYGLNGLMKHPLHQALETLGGTLPLVLLGMPPIVAALLGFAVSVQLLLQHANVAYDLGPLRHALAIGPAHRLHHRRGPAGDVNFGLFTSLPDRVLGTWVAPATRAPFEGVGVDEPVPRGYRAQLLWPFQARDERPSEMAL